MSLPQDLYHWNDWTDKKRHDIIEQVEDLIAENENLKSGHFCPHPQLAKLATTCNCVHSDKHRATDWAQISQLQAELDKHRWIPVSEGLPKESGEYQVIGEPNPRPTTRRFWSGDKTWSSYRTITHWKPITLPKENQ